MDLLVQLNTRDLDKVEYLKKLTLNGTYIDKLILTVISSILKLNIKIFNYEIEYDMTLYCFG